MTQTRTCSSSNYIDCVENEKDLIDFHIKTCEVKFIEIEGSWTDWTSWSRCKQGCGQEYMIAKRYCYFNKTLLFERSGNLKKKHCQGNHIMKKNCIQLPCFLLYSFEICVAVALIALMFYQFFYKYFSPFYIKLQKIMLEFESIIKEVKLEDAMIIAKKENKEINEKENEKKVNKRLRMKVAF